jgi:opacity protein-like surface antigen
MKNTTLLALLSFLTISMATSASQAQVPCTGAIGIGPFGIGIAVDCAPPPVIVVRPRIRRVRRPGVIIIERAPCNHRGGCRHPAPPPPPVRRRRIRRYAPVVAAPVFATPLLPSFKRFMIGANVDSSSYSDGGLVGGGVFGRYMITREIGVEASTATLKSCTNCNEFASRQDNRFGIAAVYYLGGAKRRGLNIYAKSGIIFNHITFSNEVSGWSDSVTQTNAEFGGGIELKLSDNLSLNLEATGMVASDDDEEIGLGGLNDNIAQGIPTSSKDNGSFNLRFGIAMHF